jgi:ABC-type nickel/cobalt efflux system permease component RcnA
MKKQILVAIVISATIGAITVVLLLGILNNHPVMESKDLLSFVISVASFMIAILTVVGAVVVVTTWNDIDERTEKIVSKYEKQAKLDIDTYRSKKEAELEHSAKERQAAIESSADRVTQEIKEFSDKRGTFFWQQSIILGVFMLVLLAWNWLSHNGYNRRIQQVEQTRGHRPDE